MLNYLLSEPMPNNAEHLQAQQLLVQHYGNMFKRQLQ